MARGIQAGPSIPVVLYSKDGRKLPTELVSNGLLTVGIWYYRAHLGRAFVSTYISPDASPIADNGDIDMLIVTDSQVPHIIFRVDSGGDSEVNIYEGVTTLSDGTELSRVNVNRSSTVSSTLLAYHTPTVTDTGTKIYSKFQSGGTGGFSQGDGEFSNNEFILDNATKYLIRGTNRSGLVQPMGIICQWYEE